MTKMMNTTTATTAAKTPSPYKLLDYYGYEDAGIFFGREAETRQMVGEILSSRLLVLYSPSGSGKTSLIQAGVRPQLEEMGYRTVYTRMEVGPVLSVTQAVSATLNLPIGPAKETLDLYGFLRQAVQSSGKPLVIFLDQFEEFFIVYRTQPELRREFIEQVARVKYDDELPVFLVLSLREDYLAHLHEFRSAIPSIFQNNANIRLEAFDEKAGRRAMEKPLGAVGWTLAPGLAETLIKDLNKEGTGIEPIKLQMVCGTLWEQRPAKPGEIPLSAYEALGGAETIIRRFIAGRLEKVPRRWHKLMVRVCEALKTPDNTKRYRSLEDLQTLLNIKKPRRLDAVLKPLVHLQMLREEERGGTRWYEFKHDYVAKELSRWIQDRKEKIRRRRMWYVGLPGLVLFLALFTYFFIIYNTFYAGFNSTSYSGQQEEIIISRGIPFSGQLISTGFFLSDINGYEEKNIFMEKLRISFWDRDNWSALADKLIIFESGKFLYLMGERQVGIDRLIQSIREGKTKASDYLVKLGKADQKIIVALLQALKDESSTVREEAAEALGLLGKPDQEVIVALLQALKGDTNSNVRNQAAEGLGRLGKADTNIIAALLQALKDREFYVRGQAAAALGKLGKADHDLIDALLQAMNDKESYVQYQATEALFKLGKTEPKVIAALFQAMKNEYDGVRCEAAVALGRLGKEDQKIIDALCQALRNNSEYIIREQAAEVLGDLGNAEPKVINALLYALKDEYLRIREQAANALGHLGNVEPKVIDSLLHALKDKKFYDRDMVAAALGNLKKPDHDVIAALLQVLKDKDSGLQRQIVSTLGRLGKADRDVIAALLHTLNDGDFFVRESAAKALGKLGKVDNNTTTALLLAMKDQYSNVREGAAEALGLLGKADQKVIAALLQALKDENYDVRESAGSSLGRLWQNKSEEELIKMLEDTRSEIRTAAAYALAQKKSLSPETLNEINRLKDSSPHPWVRLGAWQAFELIQEKKEQEQKKDDGKME
jgi:HEAT repeat protein